METTQGPAPKEPTPPLEGMSAEAQAAAEEEKSVSLAEHRVVKREAQGLRERLRALEQAETERKQTELTEVERLKEQLEAAEEKARTLEVGAIRSRAAAKFGLTEDLHEFITAEDESGALAQAEKLAAKLKPAAGLPSAGNRNPANGGEQAAAAVRAEQFEALRQGVPALRNRVLGF